MSGSQIRFEVPPRSQALELRELSSGQVFRWAMDGDEEWVCIATDPEHGLFVSISADGVVGPGKTTPSSGVIWLPNAQVILRGVR